MAGYKNVSIYLFMRVMWWTKTRLMIANHWMLNMSLASLR